MADLNRHSFKMLLVLFLCQILLVSSNSGSWEWSGSGSEESGSGENDNTEDLSEPTTITRRRIETTFVSIVKDSLDMLIGELGSPVEIRQLLDKNYFTGRKSMSIWAKAIEETKDTYGLSFNERDLSDFQSNIRRIYEKMMFCDEKLSKHDKKHRINHARCYEKVYSVVTEGETDFGFPTSSKAGVSRILDLNIAYNLMKLLYLELSQQLALVIGLQPMNITRNIYLTAEDIVNKYKTVEQIALDARIQQVSSVKICSVQEIFFAEFDGTCESDDKNEENEFTVAGNTSEDPFKQRLRAKVIDRKDGTEVCNILMSTNPQEDEETVRKSLRKKCNSQKKTYVKKLTEEMKTFVSHRSGAVFQELPKLWRGKEKTLKKMKSDLDKKISGS